MIRATENCLLSCINLDTLSFPEFNIATFLPKWGKKSIMSKTANISYNATLKGNKRTKKKNLTKTDVSFHMIFCPTICNVLAFLGPEPPKLCE